MIDFELQPLTTITSGTATFTQPTSGWAGVAAFQDLVSWVDVIAITAGQGAVLTLELQTAP